MRNNVIGWNVVNVIESHLDQIRTLAGLERANLVAESYRCCAAARRHAQNGYSRQGLRVHAVDFLQERSESHLLPHVEVVIAGGAVRAKANADSGIEHLGN